jgi:hypothetical protein
MEFSSAQMGVTPEVITVRMAEYLRCRPPMEVEERPYDHGAAGSVSPSTTLAISVQAYP